MNELEQDQGLLLQKFIDSLREMLGPDFIEVQIGFFKKLGQISSIVGGLLGLLIGIVGAIKSDSFLLFGFGVGWVFLSAVFYYAGSVTLPSCESSVKNNPTSISSFRILDAFAALIGLLIVFAVVGLVYTTIKFEEFDILKYGIPVLVFMFFFVYLLLFPEQISTKQRPSMSAGQDALAIFSIFGKAAMRLVPISYGSLTAVGAYILGYTLYGFFGDSGVGKVFELIGSGIEGLVGTSIFIYGLLYPLISYIFFVIFFLSIDLAKNILSISKIEENQWRGGGVPDVGQNGGSATTVAGRRDSVERSFHLSIDGTSGETQVVSESELHSLYRQQRISDGSLIWTDGWSEWRSYKDVFG